MKKAGTPDRTGTIWTPENDRIQGRKREATELFVMASPFAQKPDILPVDGANGINSAAARIDKNSPVLLVFRR